MDVVNLMPVYSNLAQPVSSLLSMCLNGDTKIQIKDRKYCHVRSIINPYNIHDLLHIGIINTRYTHAQMPRAECIITIIHITGQPAVFCSYPSAWSADAVLLSAGFWPAELVLSPELVS